MCIRIIFAFTAIVSVILSASLAQTNSGSSSKGKSNGSKGIAAAAAKPAAAVPEIQRVVDGLLAKGIGRGKGEFETTEEYDKRREAALLSIGRKHSFVLSDVADYDADSEHVTFTLSGTLSNRFMKSEDDGSDYGDFMGLVLTTKLLSRRSYVGQNGFGVKATIQESKYQTYGVVISDNSAITFEDDKTLFVTMKREEARKSIGSLRIVIDGEIESGALYLDFDSTTATISSPYASETRGYFVPFVINRIRVVDIRTGKDVSVFTPEDEA